MAGSFFHELRAAVSSAGSPAFRFAGKRVNFALSVRCHENR
jgi:hypothetical protein